MKRSLSGLSKFFEKKWNYTVTSEMRKVAMENQFIFIHIPKTAGTTFRFILYNHFSAKDIYPTQKELRANNGLYLAPKDFLAQEKYLGKAMLVGHFHINFAKRIKIGRIKKLAFFRNPLDRILSTIKHIKSFDTEFKNEDVNVILEKKWKRIMHGQCIAMGYNQDKKNLKQVRQNIIDLDFIGITEYFEESIQLCNATFDWQLENIEPRNKLNQEVFSLLSPKSKMNISRGLGPEMRTYNIALNQFVKRCKLHNITLQD